MSESKEVKGITGFVLRHVSLLIITALIMIVVLFAFSILQWSALASSKRDVMEQIGLNATHFAELNTGFPQRLLHSVQQAAPYNRAATIHNHHFPCTMLTSQRTDLHFSISSEYKLGRTVKNKIVHTSLFYN